MPDTRLDPRWYTNKALLQGAKDRYGSLEKAAEAIGGVHPSTLQKQWRKLGLERIPPGPTPKSPANREALEALYESVYDRSA